MIPVSGWMKFSQTGTVLGDFTIGNQSDRALAISQFHFTDVCNGDTL